jgi:hypothetical protein
MIDLYLDPNTHDLVVDNFTLKITTSKEEEITQRLKIKLLWWDGEWKFNENYGIKYKTLVFTKGIDLEDIDDMFRTEIANEEGVLELLSYSSLFNQSTRELTVNAKVKTDSGEIINLSFNV